MGRSVQSFRVLSISYCADSLGVGLGLEGDLAGEELDGEECVVGAGGDELTGG